jgi:hypothetical protein
VPLWILVGPAQAGLAPRTLSWWCAPQRDLDKEMMLGAHPFGRELGRGQPAGDLRAASAGTSWAFVLRPVNAQRTRLLLRARNNVAPRRLAGLLDIPIGLVDVYEGGGMLRGIWARATQPA